MPQNHFFSGIQNLDKKILSTIATFCYILASDNFLGGTLVGSAKGEARLLYLEGLGVTYDTNLRR